LFLSHAVLRLCEDAEQMIFMTGGEAKMKESFSCFLALALLSLFLATSSLAASKTAPTPATSTAPTQDPQTAVQAPTPPTAPVAPTAPATAKPTETLPSSFKAGNLTFTHPHLSVKGDHIDLFMSVKNDGKSDERMGGGGSTWNIGDVVQVTKDKNGKEQEAPVALLLPAGKTVDLTNDETWIRVKGVGKELKTESVFPISFYFRSSPNANLKIALKGDKDDGGGSVMDWFKK
jgi:copper(I)-binding protein